MTNFERPVVVNVMFLNVYSGFRHFRKDSGRYVLGRGFLLVVVDDSQQSLERPTRSSGRATVSFCKKKQTLLSKLFLLILPPHSDQRFSITKIAPPEKARLEIYRLP